MRRGRYYLGRIIVASPHISKKNLFDVAKEAPTIHIGKFAWTITDVVDNRNNIKLPYLFGRLSKFSKEGHVKKVDTNSRSQVEEPAENLLIASAPFVYLPKYSGIAYLHVWNGIDERIFPKRFKKIIEGAHKDFFVNFNIEPISDYRAFSAKLRRINTFTQITAKIVPPTLYLVAFGKTLKII